MPPRSACVRRAPKSKAHTRPSSPPSGWQDAQAIPKPELEWKMVCPVSSVAALDNSSAFSPCASSAGCHSMAGERVCTTSRPPRS